MVLSLVILILLTSQARAGIIQYYPPHSQDKDAVNFGVFEAAAAEAVVVEAPYVSNNNRYPAVNNNNNNNRHPKQLGIHFGAYSGGAQTQAEDNTDCKGYSMLGCV